MPPARREDRHGSSLSELRRPRCSQGDGRRLRPARQRRQGRPARFATFKTTTERPAASCRTGLRALGCTHVAMEATGVYWKPVWNILDDGDFELLLANAAHVKNVPGRKTDVNDATGWPICLAHGLLRAQLRARRRRPQELRGPAAHAQAAGARAREPTQRIQKTLEDANIKLDSVITDIMGTSGRAMIEALIAGETDPATLAGLATRRLKASPETLREALRGRVTRHHRFLLRLHLQQIDALDARHRRDRPGGRGQPRSLSRRRPALTSDPRHRRARRPASSSPRSAPT